jgi:hypothetical protein
MQAYATRRRTDHDEWTQDRADAHGSEVRSLYPPEYPEVDGEQGVPYAEFLHVKRTVNGLASTMSNLERKMDHLATCLESFRHSSDSASSKQGSGPPPPPPFPNFSERRTLIPSRREADELFVKVIMLSTLREGSHLLPSDGFGAIWKI